MRFSQQVHYAVCGLFDLAYNGQGDAVQVRVIGERQQIPMRYLEQIFQRLRKAGLVEGKRGPGGGYRLAMAPEHITLRRVIEAVEGPIGGRERDEAGGDRGSRSETYRPEFLWAEVAGRLAEVLDQTTLDRICSRAARVGIPRAGADAYTYQI